MILRLESREDNRNEVEIEPMGGHEIRTDSDVVGISALMTTSMLAMPELVKKLRAKNPNVRIMLGGAPLHKGRIIAAC